MGKVYRVCAHKLHSETGRHTKPKTPSQLRFCPYCPNEVENELHFLLKCNKYNTDRTDLVSKLNFINLSTLSDEDKLQNLISYNNGDTEAINPFLTFIDNSTLLRGGHVHGN
jgi:hypothetical protein